MGLLFFEAFGDIKHAQIKELASEFKLPISVVEKHYDKMLEGLKNETTTKKD